MNTLESRLKEKAPLIQAILGPRQVGKTTGIKQLVERLKVKSIYISADDLAPLDGRKWLYEHWALAKGNGKQSLLIIDEIQKIDNWSESIKKLWDETSPEDRPKLVILGSSSWSLQSGLRESLAGRYELIKAPHWNYPEAKDAFATSFADHLTFGGYPKVLEMRKDQDRAMSYLRDSIYTPVIGKDLLILKEIKKPALLRQIFELVTLYPAQELSYRKMLGQLQDSGNSETAKHYLEVLEAAFLIRCLKKFSGSQVVQKSSSPKMITLAPCFHTLFAGRTNPENQNLYGRLFEQWVGQVLLQYFPDVYYWRDGNVEIDFVVKQDGIIFGIEVKSGRLRSHKSFDAFKNKFKKALCCIVTMENKEDFMLNPLKFLQESSV